LKKYHYITPEDRFSSLTITAMDEIRSQKLTTPYTLKIIFHQHITSCHRNDSNQDC